jgi:hypothetical protein
MPGLLDILGGNFGTDDPRQAAYLALASGLMSGRGNFNQVAGNALMDAQKSYQGANQLKQRSEMNQLEMDDIRRKARQAEEHQRALAEFMKSIPTPEAEAQSANTDAMNAAGGFKNAIAVTPQAPNKNEVLLDRAMRAGLVSPLDILKARQKDTTPIKVGKDDRLFSHDLSKVLVNAAPEKQDAFVQLMTQAGIDPKSQEGQKLLRSRLETQSTHQPGVNVSYGAPVAGVGPDGKPIFFQPDKGGGKPSIIPGVAPQTPANTLNDTQAKALGYADRAIKADAVIRELEGKYSPSSIASKTAMEALGPVGWAANSALSPSDQKAEQAQRDFVNAVLRPESGAVINPSEFDNARKQYFPQPGDSKEVKEQKAKNRRTKIEGLLKEVPEKQRIPIPAENEAKSPPIDKLKEGHVTTFSNGQKWTMQSGQPVQVE